MRASDDADDDDDDDDGRHCAEREAVAAAGQVAGDSKRECEWLGQHIGRHAEPRSHRSGGCGGHPAARGGIGKRSAVRSRGEKTGDRALGE